MISCHWAGIDRWHAPGWLGGRLASSGHPSRALPLPAWIPSGHGFGGPLSVAVPQSMQSTYRPFRKPVLSRPVPSWSTSFKMPWTLALILKTWRESEDWRVWKAESSELAVDESEREGRAKPVSMSAKDMIAVV